MSRRSKSAGVNAVAWFNAQSFHSFQREPSGISCRHSWITVHPADESAPFERCIWCRKEER